MKYFKSFLPFLLLFFLPHAYSATATCTGTVACPAGYTGVRTYQGTFTYPSNVGSPSQYCAWNPLTADSVRDNRWVLVSDTCAPIGPAYQSTQTETQSLTCPATQPGVWTQSRTYELWSDGSHRNVSDWVDVTKTCAAAPISTGTETQSLACPATQPSGSWIQQRSYTLWSDGSKTGFTAWVDKTKTCVAIKKSTETEYRNLNCATDQNGSMQQKRTYDLWTDGSKKNYSSWSVSANSCAIKSITANPNRKEACPIGYTGYKEYQWTVKYKNVDYTTKDADGNNVTYTLSTPYQEEQLKTDTCTLIPTQTVETKDGSQELTCDSYYGVSSGTYTGTVYKYGQYVATYDSAKKSTDTVFNVTSIDATACIPVITNVTQETKSGTCPAGTTGSISYYRFKADNSKGETVYPYGTDWMVDNNNCATTAVDSNPIDNTIANPDGLLSNISVTASSLQNGEEFSKYLNSLSASNWAASERHKLIVNIDDLSSGKYSASKVGAVISKFQSVIGSGNSDVEVVLPRTIDKYIGVGGITASAAKEKTAMIKDIYFDGINAKLTYLEFSKEKTGKPTQKVETINIIPANLGLKGIMSN